MSPAPASRPGVERARALAAAVLVTIGVAATAPAAGAATLPPGHFDPTAPSSHYPSLLGTRLAGPNAMQSFGFDEVARNVYVVQTVEGGAKRNGDLWVSRIDYGGRLLDHMRLNGFGHGASMGVSRSGSAVSLWVESASRPNDAGEGRGTRVARVIYRAGAVVTPASSGVVDVTPPQARSRSPRPTVDPATGNLIVRYGSKAGTWAFLSVPRADALAGRWSTVRLLGSTPSAGRTRPGTSGTEIVSQGYALAAGHAYLYYGDSYDHVAKPGDAYIRVVPLDPKKRVSGFSGGTASLKDLPFREPEGIAVQLNGGRPRLVFGFASDPVTKPDRTQRFANFSYKQRYVRAAPAPSPTPVPPPPAPVPPPAAAPGPQALTVTAHRVARRSLRRARRISITAGGLDAAARVRVHARLGRRVVRIYSKLRTVRVARHTIRLTLASRHARRLLRARGRVRLTISVTVGDTTRRVRATVPRR